MARVRPLKPKPPTWGFFGGETAFMPKWGDLAKSEGNRGLYSFGEGDGPRPINGVCCLSGPPGRFLGLLSPALKSVFFFINSIR